MSENAVQTIKLQSKELLQLLRTTLKESLFATDAPVNVVISTYNMMDGFHVKHTLVVPSENPQLNLVLCCGYDGIMANSLGLLGELQLQTSYLTTRNPAVLDTLRQWNQQKASTSQGDTEAQITQLPAGRHLLIVYVGLSAMPQMLQYIQASRQAHPDMLIVAVCCYCDQHRKEQALTEVVDFLAFTPECGGFIMMGQIAKLIAEEW